MVNFNEDSVLLNRFKSGNNNSFKLLFLKHKSRIFNYINYKVNDVDISNDILKICNKDFAKNGQRFEFNKVD